MNTYVFAKAVTRKKIAQTVNVLPSAVSNAIAKGQFPPSWFAACKMLADEAQIDCPPELFAMRGLENEGEAA